MRVLYKIEKNTDPCFKFVLEKTIFLPKCPGEKKKQKQEEKKKQGGERQRGGIKEEGLWILERTSYPELLDFYDSNFIDLSHLISKMSK